MTEDSWVTNLPAYLFMLMAGLWWGFFPRVSQKFWLVLYRITHILRLVDKQPQWCNADITFHIPIDVSMSWERGPTLHWQASSKPTTLETSEPLPKQAMDGLTTQVEFQDGSLEIAQGKFAAELSVDPEDHQNLCLELRSIHDKTRLHIALTPQDLPTMVQGKPLPQIERHSIVLEPQARQELLQQLALAAQMEGLKLPVQLQQEVTQHSKHTIS